MFSKPRIAIRFQKKLVQKSLYIIGRAEGASPHVCEDQFSGVIDHKIVIYSASARRLQHFIEQILKCAGYSRRKMFFLHCLKGAKCDFGEEANFSWHMRKDQLASVGTVKHVTSLPN